MLSRRGGVKEGKGEKDIVIFTLQFRLFIKKAWIAHWIITNDKNIQPEKLGLKGTEIQ